jgi:cell shape-determining protein MreC
MAFAGIWEDGCDDFYEYGGMNSEQAAEELPSALDEMFGISESMAEWEADNEELEEELDANTQKDI